MTGDMKVVCGVTPLDSPRNPATRECSRKPVTHCNVCSSISFSSSLQVVTVKFDMHLIKVKFPYKISSIRSLSISKIFLVLVCFEADSGLYSAGWHENTCTVFLWSWQNTFRKKGLVLAHILITLSHGKGVKATGGREQWITCSAYFLFFSPCCTQSME